MSRSVILRVQGPGPPFDGFALPKPPAMVRRIASVVILVFYAVTGIAFMAGAALLWIVTRPFDRRLRVLHQFSCFWASFYLWTNPYWRVEVRGREHLDPDTASVFVSNHQSALDILVAYRLFAHFKWVSKAEVFRVPVVGWNMYLNRYVKLHRGDSESAREALDACKRHLAEGSSVYFFPEGTRSRTGTMRTFKTGAFVLAKEMRVPITPVAISGTVNALPKRSLNIRGNHRMRIEVLPPIPYREFADTPPRELAQDVRGQIGALVAEHREPEDGDPDREQPQPAPSSTSTS
jgi:1-acyl-sn-glycerol-3-phosphate acyltransferase